MKFVLLMLSDVLLFSSVVKSEDLDLENGIVRQWTAYGEGFESDWAGVQHDYVSCHGKILKLLFLVRLYSCSVGTNTKLFTVPQN